MLPLILLMFAFVLFVIGVVLPTVGRYNLISAGLACWVLSELVRSWH